jgi:hypothetical protein
VAKLARLVGRLVDFAQAHAVPLERQSCTWEDLLAQGQIADTALVAALEADYDVLLEGVRPPGGGVKQRAVKSPPS